MPLDPPRAFLLDFDGVIATAGQAVPGSAEAIGEIRRRGLPFRVITNTSLWSRATLAAVVAKRGLAIEPDHWITALSISAAWTARRMAGRPLFVIASDDALKEFDGQVLLADQDAARSDSTAAAVVIGDAAEKLTWANVNAAFGLVRRGAQLIAMHRNKWWLTEAGPTIDSGAFVAAIEYAAEAKAVVIGKPARTAYSEAVRSIRRERPGLRRSEILMVGDDIDSDIAGGRRAGLQTAFVLSGKHGPAEIEAARRRGRPDPDRVAGSLAELVDSL